MPIKYDKRKPLHKAAAAGHNKILGAAKVNLTWYARALEDGEPENRALIEVYQGDKSKLAKDIRTLLVNARDV